MGKEEERRKALVLLTQERDRLKEEERAKEKEAEKAKEREKLKEREAVEKEWLKQEKREFKKEKKKAKKEKKEKDKEKDKEKSKKEKKKEKKEKKKEKREKEKEKKPEEPSLFTPVLKIKPPAPPSETKTSPDSTPVATPQTTPKLVIKNLPKEKDKDKETESVPMLGFQPLRTGPARTPKAAVATAASAPSPSQAAKPGEKRKSSRPPAGGPASKTPGPASKSAAPATKASTPAPGPGPKERKVREGRGRPVKSKEIIDSSVDSGDEPTPGIITETVGSYTDEAGNKVWICPTCGKQDDGSPMIGCDQCDDWYHWLCVGINSEPSENQDWFCTRCMAKKQGLYLDKTATFHPKQRRK